MLKGNEALALGDVSAAGLQPYDVRWRGLMESEIRWGSRLRGLCERLPDPVVERLHWLLRVPALRRALLSTRATFDWHSVPLLRALDHFQRYLAPD